MCSKTVVFLVFLTFAVCEAKEPLNIHKYLHSLKGKSYRNHALLRGVPNDYEDLEFFKKIESLYNVTLWKKPTLVHNAVEFSISPDNLAELYRDTARQPIHLTTLTKNIQSAFDKQRARPYTKGTMQSFNWHSYYRLDDIYDWLKDLSDTYPDEVRLRSIGKSYENRTILAVKLTLKGSIRRSKVIVEGGCHGNEWISPAFVTYMLNTLLNIKKYDNEELETIALMYSWVFIPVMNPDGYEYAHMTISEFRCDWFSFGGGNSRIRNLFFTQEFSPVVIALVLRAASVSLTDIYTDRLWRKNRRGGYGVDLNRNYGIAFGAHCPDKSKTENREYCGDSPFSEPESEAMSLFTKENSDNLEYYLSFHSFGQNIILPYSTTIEHKDNYNVVKKKADKIASRILEKHGIEYTVGNNYDIDGYLASGTSSDWVKRALKVPYVATFQLPDTGVHGYALPPERILPTCQATMDGLLLFFDPDLDKFLRSGDNNTQHNPIHITVILLCNVALCVLYRVH